MSEQLCGAWLWPGLNHDRCIYRKAHCPGRSRHRGLSKVVMLFSHILRAQFVFSQHFFKKQITVMGNSTVWVSVVPVSSFNCSNISSYKCVDTHSKWFMQTKIWQMKQPYVGEIVCKKCIKWNVVWSENWTYKNILKKCTCKIKYLFMLPFLHPFLQVSFFLQVDLVLSLMVFCERSLLALISTHEFLNKFSPCLSP